MTVDKHSLMSCMWVHFPDSFPVKLPWVKGECICRCDLPPALLSEWLGSLTCHCCNIRVEQTPNKSQHTKLSLEKKILLQLQPSSKLATFWSWVWRSTNWAIPITYCLSHTHWHHIKNPLPPRIYMFLIIWTTLMVIYQPTQSAKHKTLQWQANKKNKEQSS